MRRGRSDGAWKRGGAWQCGTILRAEESTPGDSSDTGITANALGECGTPRSDEGCKKAVCIFGMVLQQS
jgi:hypothetical protein